MTHISRRDALGLAVGAAAAPLLPAPCAATPPTFPAWAVGTYGRHNWRVFYAESESVARQMWVAFNGLSDYPKEVPELSVNDAPWIPHGAHGEKPTLEASDYQALDWDYACDRCGETVGEYEVVEKDGICHDCMTEDDWRIADPEYAEDEYGSATAGSSDGSAQ